MTLLLISLPLGSSPLNARYDYVLSDDGRAVKSYARCNVRRLPKLHSKAHEIVAVVPSSALSWHRVQLPLGTLPARFLKQTQSPKLRAVLEGLLEDQLLDEPAKLHFALQPDARTDEPTWVAVCDKQWLHEALDVLQQTGCAPHKVVPEWAPILRPTVSSPVRSQKTALWVTGTPEAAQLVWADNAGVHTVPASQARGLPDYYASLGPSQAKLLAEPAVEKLAEQLLRQEVHMVTPAKRLLRCAASPWNLAQGDLVRRNPWLQRWNLSVLQLLQAPQWRAARWAALALVLIQVIGINTWAWHANSTLKQKQKAIGDTLLASFPQTTAVIDAPVQMQRTVNTLRQATGAAKAQDLESLLSAMGAASSLQRARSAPSGLEYSEGVLRIKGLGLASDVAQTLDQELQASGYSSRLDGDTLVLQVRSAP